MRGVREAFGQMFFVGKDILGTFLDAATNVILAQTGDSTTGVVESDRVEWWQPLGFVSRPAPPTQGRASAQACGFKGTDYDVVLGTRDLRGSKIYGNLKDGEACIYAPVGAARTFYKANGHVVLYTTTTNDDTGKAISLDLGPSGVILSTPWGGFTLDAAHGFVITVGQAAVVLTPTGDGKLLGTTATVSGSVAAIAGQVMTMIGPNATPATACAIQAPGTPGPTSLPSATVFVSP